jgi:hypothetical protein
MTGATFCVYADDLDPAAVTARLGITPTRSFKHGERITTRRATYGNHPTGGWLLESRDQIQSDDLDVHLTWLLDRLRPATSAIHSLRDEGLDAAIILVVSAAPTGGGPTIPSATLDAIAKFRVPVDFDIYT